MAGCIVGQLACRTIILCFVNMYIYSYTEYFIVFFISKFTEGLPCYEIKAMYVYM